MANLNKLSFKGIIINLFTESRYKHFRDVFWFAVITLTIHYSYRFWAISLQYWPIQASMNELHQMMTGWILNQTIWVDRYILNISMNITGQTITFDNGSWISINESCAGDKQILQFALLILVYPGIWKRKLWYIPLGMVIIHLTNILRIVLLSIVSINNPEYWHIAHNTVLRAMFYVVILALWIIWVERINKKPEVKSLTFMA
jgi:exosortase/archaeosortase family protein